MEQRLYLEEPSTAEKSLQKIMGNQGFLRIAGPLERKNSLMGRDPRAIGPLYTRGSLRSQGRGKIGMG